MPDLAHRVAAALVDAGADQSQVALVTSHAELRELPDTVREGPIAPAFGQPGGGLQYHFDKPIEWYIENGPRPQGREGRHQMISTEADLRAAFDEKWSSGQSGPRVWPGPDEAIDPGGSIVVDGTGGHWRVFRMSRGPRDVRAFDDQAEAYDYAYRRWALWDEDA